MLIQTESLTKQYGAFTALNECSISVREGEIFGLLGPNGSGKSTLIRLLMGFLRPTRGRATINDLDCYFDSVKVHRLVAYLPGDARLFRRMRAQKVMRFFANMRPDGNYGKSLQIAERLDLNIRQRVGLMSTGLRQKLALVVALANSSRVLILDEPTANLDPNVRADIIKILLEGKTDGQTILLSSHVLSEIEDSCDRVGILKAGEVVHTQTMQELRKRYRILANGLRQEITPPTELEKSNIHVVGNDDTLKIECDGDLAPVLHWLVDLKLENVRIETIGLKAVYDRYHSPTQSPEIAVTS